MWLGLEDERESEGVRKEARAREGRRSNASSSTASDKTDNRMSPVRTCGCFPVWGGKVLVRPVRECKVKFSG